MLKKGEQPRPEPGVVLGEGEIARREGGRVWVREAPVRVRFELGELVAGDGHGVRVGFGCSVAARPEAAERQMLEESLLGQRGSCTAADVVGAFMPAVQEAGRRVIAGKGAREWLGEGGRPELVEALRKAVDVAGFAAGVEVLPPYQVEVESPSIERMERERVAREMAEREQAGRLEHLRRAAEVVGEFEKLRKASPGVSVAELVRGLAAGDQAVVVSSLMAAEAGKVSGESLYVVAGPCLLRAEGGTLGVEEIEVPGAGEVGPFRSVQEIDAGEGRRVALGGRGGIVVMDPAEPGRGVVYRAPGVGSALGFNRVVAWGGRVWASHSEVGIVGWELGRTEGPASWVRREEMGVEGAEGPRQLVVAGGRLVFAVGAKVVALDERLGVAGVTEDRGAGESVVALLDGGRERPASGPAKWEKLIVVRGSGRVEGVEPGTLRVVRQDTRVGRVTAAGVMPFYDRARVVLATEEGAITCLSLEDAVVTQYASPYRGMRAVAAGAGGVIAGVSADRQRVVVMATEDGRQQEIHVAGRWRHRVGDVAWVR